MFIYVGLIIFLLPFSSFGLTIPSLSNSTGGPFSSLDFTYVLYNDFLKYDPDDSLWFDRDRFVLSPGHESALLYSILCLVGWLEVDDLKLEN